MKLQESQKSMGYSIPSSTILLAANNLAFYFRNTTSTNSTRMGLPLTIAHVEQMFPKLTSAQINRIAARGEYTCYGNRDMLYEQGNSAVSFFVVFNELEVVCHSGAVRPLSP